MAAKDAFPVRTAAEFAIGLMLASMLLRAFVAEAYIVPSGSMAPTLLGHHQRVVCDAGCVHAVGTGEQARWPGATFVCPDCGQRTKLAGIPVSAGDRLLVQKGSFSWSAPRRWEPAVFVHPGQRDEPTGTLAEDNQAFVKRIVGLPGESVRIFEGDVFVDGRIARKGLDRFRSLAVTVYGAGTSPGQRWHATGRWTHADGRLLHLEAPAQDGGRSMWRDTAPGVAQEPTQRTAGPPSDARPSAASLDSRVGGEDTLGGQGAPGGRGSGSVVYRHEQFSGHAGPVQDVCWYNADRGAVRRRAVKDLAVTGEIGWWAPDGADGAGSLTLAVPPRTRTAAGVRLVATATATVAELTLAGDVIDRVLLEADAAAEAAWTGRTLRLPEPTGADNLRRFLVASVDRQLWFALDGVAVFDHVLPGGLADCREEPLPTAEPFAATAAGMPAVLGDLQVLRDVHYTDQVSGVWRPAGVGTPYPLGPDEYFMLGDNSADSEDSRAWRRPGVPRRALIGRPVLVHWPSRTVQTRWFGRTWTWSLPDWSRVRRL